MNLKLLHSRVALPPVKAKSGQRIIRATPPNAASTLLKTRVTRFVQLLRPRRSTVLSTIKISATVVGKVGSATPVPLIQPITDGVNKIIEYCETARAHKKECVELKDLVLTYADMLAKATEGVSEDKLDPHLAYALAELNDELQRIHDVMENLKRTGLIERLISASEHTELLAKHRQKLQDVITRFQTDQAIRSQISMDEIAHEVRELKGSVSLAGASSQAPFFFEISV